MLDLLFLIIVLPGAPGAIFPSPLAKGGLHVQNIVN